MRSVLALVLTITALAGCTGPTKAGGIPSPAGSEQVRKLYLGKCAKCHKLYDPAKYSDAEWEKWMEKMGRKSKLTPDQQRELSKYIENNYRQAPKP